MTSLDGTPIAYHRAGTGPPLVLVQGTGAASPLAWPSFPALAGHFTLYAVDRRGRGESGDGDSYAVEREFEDVAAVVEAIGQPAHLLGHSFGGLCSLEAALRTRNVRRLILYEPAGVPVPGEPPVLRSLIDRLQAVLETGDGEEVLTVFYREVAGMTPDEIERLRSSPAWPEATARPS